MTDPVYHLRQAAPEDAPVLAYQRRAMFAAMRWVEADEHAALENASRTQIERAIIAGSFVAWLVECDGRPVAGGGMLLRALMPRPGFLDGGTEGYLLSMWTEPEHRRKGLATRIVRAALDWCRERGIGRVSLHASDEGRLVYQRLGFASTNEMRLHLNR